MKNFIVNYEKFDEFDEIIRKNIDNLKSSYRSSKNLINKNYEDETLLRFSDKLDSLYHLSSDYYNQINESFYQIKNYLYTSIQEIDNLLKLCANNTYSAFAERYYNISNITQTKDNAQEEIETEYKIEGFKSDQQNGNYYTDVKISSLEKKAKFKFTFNFDFDPLNNLKMPKVYAHVINLSRPKKVNIEIYSTFGIDGKNVDAYEIEFNNVSYSIDLDFNTDSNNIISNVVTDFDSYKYSNERYILDYKIPECPENDNPLIVCVLDDKKLERQTISPLEDRIINKTYIKKDPITLRINDIFNI